MTADNNTRGHRRSWVFAVVATLVSVLCVVQNPVCAVDIQPAPKEVTDAMDVIGRGLASKADEQLKAEVAKYARDNLFGITGTLYPSGEVSFVRAGLCAQGDAKGAVFEFNVHARAKVDVGSRKFGVKIVRKLWGVDTQQVVQIVIRPKRRDDGSIAADISSHMVIATATTERKAKQRDADGFRDRVAKEIKATLAEYTGEHDLEGILGSIN